MLKSRFSSLVLVVCLASLTGNLVNWVSVSQMEAADSKATKLEQLLNEKLNLLERIAAQIDAKDKAGFIGVQESYEIHQAVSQARLELCKTDDERIAIMEKMAAAAKQREESMNKSAAVDGLDKIKAKINTLDYEISLERLRSK